MITANQLDLYQLRAFHAVGQTGSFTGASRRLHLTQSAVSHAVAKLEATAGMALVARRGRELRLTDAGRRLWEASERLTGVRYPLDGRPADRPDGGGTSPSPG